MAVPGSAPRLEKLVPAEAGSLLHPATSLTGTFLCLLPILFGSLGIYTTMFAADWAKEGIVRGGLSNPVKSAALALKVIGVGMAFSSFLIALRYPTALGNIYMRWLARRRIARRVAPLVRPQDREAAFVEIVPRAHWGVAMLDTATEVGFLQVDGDYRELLFEGNAERWRLPAQAILSCTVEGTDRLPGGSTLTGYYAVLRMREGEWPVEIPIAPRGSWEGRYIRKDRRRDVATQLCRRIESILQEPGPPPPKS